MMASTMRQCAVITERPTVGAIQSMVAIESWLEDETIPVRTTRDIAVMQRIVIVRNHQRLFPVRK